jgi:hypothetical protein
LIFVICCGEIGHSLYDIYDTFISDSRRSLFYYPVELELNGTYSDLESLITRNRTGLEQATILIRVGALHFSGKSKNALLWDIRILLSD